MTTPTVPSIRTTEQSALLDKLRVSLTQMQKEFTLPNRVGFEGILRERKESKYPRAKMNALLSILSFDLDDYINKRNHKNPDENAQYQHFKDVVNRHLNNDPRGKAVREPDSFFYPVHYAIVALFRAFFRIFDVLLSLGAKQTKNDTPGYEPFFKLPEASLRKRANELSKEFQDTIDALDKLKGITPSAGAAPSGNSP